MEKEKLLMIKKKAVPPGRTAGKGKALTVKGFEKNTIDNKSVDLRTRLKGIK